MGFFSFNKTPKYRVFNYSPLYYDPKKEERDAIIRRAKIEAGLIDEKEMDGDIDNAKLRITRSFHSRGISNQYKRTSHRKSNIRIAIIVIILSGLAYIILNFNVNQLVQILE